MQTDLLILQDQKEVFSTGIKSEKGKSDNICKALESDDQPEGIDADFLSTLIGITKSRGQGLGVRGQNSEPKAESAEESEESEESESLELRAEDSGIRDQGSEVKAETSELKAESSGIRGQGSEVRGQSAEEAQRTKLEAESPEVKAETRLPLQGTSGQGSGLKAESSGVRGQSAEEAQRSTLKAESTDSGLKAEEAQRSTLKAESTDSGLKAEEAQRSMLKAESTDSGLKAEEAQRSMLKAESTDSGLKAESSQPEAQRSTLKAQSLNSNLQEAGEVVKNLIKNQVSHEATSKIESNFQDIKTMTKNMENFDKNLSHKENDNVLLFPENRSSDRVSDTGLHAKDTQRFQKPLQTEVLTQIVKKAVFNLKNGQTEVKIDLKPEFLGRIQLKISTENHQVMVRMLTEIPLVKDIIENNINHLKADLQNHGLEIDKFNVFVARDSDQYKNGHENAEFLKNNGKTGEGETDDILAKEMEEEAQFAEERRGANLIGVFA